MAIGDGSEPVEHFDEVDGGLEVGGEFVVSGGETTPVFAPVEASFDLVAARVGGPVEVDRAPAVGSFALPVGDLVVGLGDDGGDAFVPQRFPVRLRGVRL